MRRIILATALLLILVSYLPAQAEESEEATPSEPRSTEEVLASIESKLDQLSRRMGSISGRNSLADYVERHLSEMQRQLDKIESDVRKVREDVRRLQSRR